MDKQIYLKEISLRDYKCFKGENVFSFYRELKNKTGKVGAYQWTVFLGNNGTGKTNILKAIANMEPVVVDTNIESSTADGTIENIYMGIGVKQGDKQISEKEPPQKMYRAKVTDRLNADGYLVMCNFMKSGSNVDLSKKECNNLIRAEYPIVQADGSRAKMTPLSRLGYGAHHNITDPTEEFDSLKIYAYGVRRIASRSGLNTELGETGKSLFYEDEKLLNFEDWLLNLKLAESNDNTAAKTILKSLEKIFSKSYLMPDIKGFKLYTDSISNNRILFVCKDGNYKFEDLGYGYQCMLSWVFDFCKRMFDRYPNSNNPLAESAVVVIDEIDLHLHPKWQRGLLKALTKLFPNTQFIVSTHSPMIIQSMDGINLFVLRHQADGSVKADRMENKNWEGWQMEEILQETMDVEDGYTSEELKEKIDHFNKACSEENLQKAENLYKELEKTVNPNGSLIQMLKMQIRDLRNYFEQK